MAWFNTIEFSSLTGLIFTEIKVDDRQITFKTADGKIFKMYHEQDCCESVYVEGVVGDVNDLIGEPILLAEESTNSAGDRENGFGSSTWTFYKLATRKGYVDIRWIGTSNGYYSESVSLIEEKDQDA